MTIGVYTIKLHLPLARSLKDKRQVFRRLKDRLRSRYNIALAESPEHSDLWQRGCLTIVSVAHSRDALVRLFESIYRDAERDVPGHIVESLSDFIEGTEDGSAGWLEDRP